MVRFTEYGIVINFDLGYLDGIKDGYQSALGALMELLDDNGITLLLEETQSYIFVNSEADKAYSVTDDDIMALEKGCRIAIGHRDLTEEEYRLCHGDESKNGTRNASLDIDGLTAELCDIAGLTSSENIVNVEKVLYYIEGRAENDPAFRTFLDVLVNIAN